MPSLCPICNCDRQTPVAVYDQPHNKACIFSCEACSHAYTAISGEIDQDYLYNEETYKVVENRGSVFDRILNWEYSRILGVLAKLLPRKGSLLDFGCGKGKFSSVAAQQGWSVTCVETSVSRAAYAREVYGLTVSEAFYNGGRIGEHDYQVIALLHVLEHLPEPITFLQALIGDNLSHDGILLIEVPNRKSWQCALAGKNWMHYDIPRHLQHFTPQSISLLADKLKLSIVQSSSFSVHLGVFGMLAAWLRIFGYMGNLIYDLKNKKSLRLKLGILILLPPAFLLEGIAAMFGRGGVLRYYFQRS